MRVAHNVGRVYARREPEKDLLYRLVQEHLETFLQGTQSDEHAGLPRHVRREFYGYLDCGILARGAARVACAACNDSILVAFSCRGRGFCPSCGARRMSDTAAHLVDRVLPHVPIRQWVLSLPFRVRFLCARDPTLLRAVLRVFLREVQRCIRRLLRRDGVRGARGGSVTAVQRFGGNLGLNVHLHALVLDGAFARDSADALEFHELRGLRQGDVARVAARTAAKVTALLTRRGLGSADATDDAAAEEPDVLATLCAASATERVALGPKAGWRITHVGGGGDRLTSVRVPPSADTLLAEADGYNVHAGVLVPARARTTLERLAKYILRPPLARDRLTQAADGRVFWELKRPYDDGTTHLAFEPLVFLERLAALVPPPRVHLVIYNGVLSSHASWRAEVLPPPDVEPRPHVHDAHDHVPGDEAGGDGVPRAGVAEPSTEPLPDVPGLRARRLRWAQLLQRVLGLDILKCGKCGGNREVVAFIVRPSELKRICAHLGYPSEAPAIAPARAPPQPDLWDHRATG